MDMPLVLAKEALTASTSSFHRRVRGERRGNHRNLSANSQQSFCLPVPARQTNPLRLWCARPSLADLVDWEVSTM